MYEEIGSSHSMVGLSLNNNERHGTICDHIFMDTRPVQPKIEAIATPISQIPPSFQIPEIPKVEVFINPYNKVIFNMMKNMNMEGNIVMSPYSLKMALYMLLNGVAGDSIQGDCKFSFNKKSYQKN